MNSSKYIHFGCGMCAPEGWRNFDGSPTVRFERIPLLGRLYTKNEKRFPANVEYGDIVRGLPVPDGSCRAVYCSHVLEHLALEDFEAALRNTYRMLEDGGVFRLVVPDLESQAQNYVNNPSDDAAISFVRATRLGARQRQRGWKAAIFNAFRNSGHLWMWDCRAMTLKLRETGFRDIRRAKMGDSADPKFKEVEEERRWNTSLGIECRR